MAAAAGGREASAEISTSTTTEPAVTVTSTCEDGTLASAANASRTASFGKSVTVPAAVNEMVSFDETGDDGGGGNGGDDGEGGDGGPGGGDGEGAGEGGDGGEDEAGGGDGEHATLP